MRSSSASALASSLIMWSAAAPPTLARNALRSISMIPLLLFSACQIAARFRLPDDAAERSTRLRSVREPTIAAGLVPSRPIMTRVAHTYGDARHSRSRARLGALPGAGSRRGRLLRGAGGAESHRVGRGFQSVLFRGQAGGNRPPLRLGCHPAPGIAASRHRRSVWTDSLLRVRLSTFFRFALWGSARALVRGGGGGARGIRAALAHGRPGADGRRDLLVGAGAHVRHLRSGLRPVPVLRRARDGAARRPRILGGRGSVGLHRETAPGPPLARPPGRARKMESARGWTGRRPDRFADLPSGGRQGVAPAPSGAGPRSGVRSGGRPHADIERNAVAHRRRCCRPDRGHARGGRGLLVSEQPAAAARGGRAGARRRPADQQNRTARPSGGHRLYPGALRGGGPADAAQGPGGFAGVSVIRSHWCPWSGRSTTSAAAESAGLFPSSASPAASRLPDARSPTARRPEPGRAPSPAEST